VLLAAAPAATIPKADNADPLNLATSWVGGIVPGANDIALWDFHVTTASLVALGANTSWAGLKIADPGGAVTISAGNTLTLGRQGLDLSAATQNLTLDSGVTLLAEAAQHWKIGAGRTVQLNGTLTRGANAMLNIDLGPAAVVNIASGAASAILPPYATLNRTDFAALDAARNVVAGRTSGTVVYTDNPDTGAALPNLNGTFAVLDVVFSNTNAISAFRLNNNMTITHGARFDTPHAGGQDWVVDINTRNYNAGGSAILVTPNVGAGHVIYNGGTGNIRLGAGTELMVHQHNLAGDLIFNAQVTQPAGAGATITKAGAGRLILTSDTNSYSGPTRILEGTVQIGNGGTTGTIVSSSVINHGTLAFNRTNAVTFAIPISGTGAVTQAGTGTLALTGTNTYTGPTNFNAGTTTFTALGNFGGGTALNFGGGTLQWTTGNTTDISARTVTFHSTGTLDTNGNNVTLAGTVGGGGAGGFTKAGAGVLTLAGANDYAGLTQISAGTLRAANAGGSATGSGPVQVGSGGTLAGPGSLAGLVTVQSGGVLAPGTSVGTLTVGGLTLNAGAVLDFEFNTTPANDRIMVSGAGGLTLNGGGFNLYHEGGTSAFHTPGTYSLIGYSGSVGGAGPGALSVLNPMAGFNYTFASTPSFVTLTISAAGLLTEWLNAGGGTWGSDANWSNTSPNMASATANFFGAATAPATVTLDGAKTVGAIAFNNANGYTITPGTGGTLTLDNGPGAAQVSATTGSHAVNAPLTLASNLTASVAAGASLSISGPVSGAKALTKTGNGTLVLGGAVSTYSLGTVLLGGIVEFAALGGLGTGEVSFDGGTLRWAPGNTADLSERTITIGTGGATLHTNGNTVSLLNPIGNGGAGGLTKAGAGTLTLLGTNTYQGGTTITGGMLGISANGQLGSEAIGAGLTLNGGGLQVTASTALDNFGLNPRPLTIGSAGGVIEVQDFAALTIAGVASGTTGTLAKTGPGTLLLTGNNVATLGSTVLLSGGTIELGGGQPNTQRAIGTGTLVFQGGTLQMNGHLADNVNGYGTLASPIVVPAGQSGTLKMTTRGLLSSTLTGAGTFNLQVNFIRGDVNPNWNGFTGQINVLSTNPGDGNDELRLSNFVALNIPAARLHLGDGVSMFQNFNPPNTGDFTTLQIIGELSGAPTAFLGGNPVAGRFVNWQVGALNTDAVFAGTIANSAGAALLTKVGNGRLTLSGVSTYTGATTVNGGTLLVNGSLNGTPVTVNNGGTLGGTGTIATAGQNVLVQAGGRLAPGASLGTLTFDLGSGTLDLAAAVAGTNTQALIFELGPPAASDQIVLTSGALNLGASGFGFGLAFDDFVFGDAGVQPGTYTLFDTSTTLLGNLDGNAANLTGLIGAFTATLQISPDDQDVLLIVVPEPSAVALLGAALLPLAFRRRQR
jgi:autotransporter-associated beta strand protein